MIFRALHSLRDKLAAWTVQKAKSKHALTWLSAVSFSESSFFPIPPDILLAPIVVAGERGRWAWYAALTTIMSVFGGLFGYLIGAVFFDVIGTKIVEWYHLADAFSRAEAIFNSHTFFAMFAAAFSPIPYKVFTIAGGLFSANILLFVLASLLGRGLRFFIVAYVMHHFGRGISGIIYKYFNILTLVAVAAIFILVIFL